MWRMSLLLCWYVEGQNSNELCYWQRLIEEVPNTLKKTFNKLYLNLLGASDRWQVPMNCVTECRTDSKNYAPVGHY